MRYAVALLFLFVFASASQASDYAREKYWADQITPDLVVGEPVYLKAQNHEFLALYTRAEKPKGAVILVHGLGVHPDWGLIGVLRTRLPDAAYTTLSVQMPVFPNEAKQEAYLSSFGEAAARLAQAVSYLQSQGYKRIAIVSHSMGSRMADHYFALHPDTPVSAWVAIGMPTAFESVGKIKFPVLDLYGEHDMPTVLATANQRGRAIRSIRGAEQIRVAGTNHFFEGHDDDLLRNVTAFLDKTWAATR